MFDMKIYYLFLFILFISLRASSQDTITFTKEKNQGKDLIIFDIYHDFWQEIPSNVNVRAINQGVNMYAMLNRPIKTTNFSIALGIGLSSHNLYSDAIPVLERNQSNQPTGNTIFTTLGNYYQKTVEYKINKINLSYIDIPIELRFKTRAERNKRFRASLGFKIGYNVSNHTKYKGEDVIENTSEQVVIKKSNIRNVSNWNYGIIGRIGYGRFNLMTYYSLSKIFEKGKGPQIFPISVGLSIMPF